MKTKKLGILTFHRANNFGAALQAYAMKRVCENLGYEVYFIRYSGYDVPERHNPIRDFLHTKDKLSGLFILVRALMSYFGDVKRLKEFERFREKYFQETVFCHSVDEIAALGFDAYIAGSDQIWNDCITGGKLDSGFFLNFGSTASKIVYAASSQDVPFPAKKERELKKLLLSTNAAVTIRESSLSEYCSSLTGVEYPIVLDPTLLAGRSVMEEISIKKKSKHGTFILLYQIDANPNSDVSVKTIEKRFGQACFTMTVPRLGSIHGRKGDIGPEQFLFYLKHAEFLVTNSFHGVALSLLYNKQFYVYENGGVMSRIDDLLSLVGLTDRKIAMVADIDLNKKINYDQVNQKLAMEREHSLQYLQSALNGMYEVKKYSFGATERTKIPFMERKKADCCGCTACEEICPVHAIKMEIDQEGFYYPVQNEEKCIHCGFCDRVCGFELGKKVLNQKAYGVKHISEQQRKESRSGGAFVAFSDQILERNGSIYGAVMESDFSVKHSRAVSKIERAQMQKAKYVQSDLRGVFPQVAKDLINGQVVLFTGTPCQVSGLKHYILEKNISDEKLFTCDLICHGVPSPLVWSDYLKYIESRYHQKIKVAEFRDKSFGWDTHCESFILERRKKKVVSRAYTDLFYQHIMFRPSCANCPFANMNRVGDITLGDFWGIERHDASFNDNKGVSLILVNSDKGAELFEMAKSNLIYFECIPEECLQPTLQRPSKESPKRSMFWKDYKVLEFNQVLKKYTVPIEQMARIKYRVKQILYLVGIRKHP